MIKASTQNFPLGGGGEGRGEGRGGWEDGRGGRGGEGGQQLPF